MRSVALVSGIESRKDLRWPACIDGEGSVHGSETSHFFKTISSALGLWMFKAVKRKSKEVMVV